MAYARFSVQRMYKALVPNLARKIFWKAHMARYSKKLDAPAVGHICKETKFIFSFFLNSLSILASSRLCWRARWFLKS